MAQQPDRLPRLLQVDLGEQLENVRRGPVLHTDDVAPGFDPDCVEPFTADEVRKGMKRGREAQ